MASKYSKEVMVKGAARKSLQRTIDTANKRLVRLEKNGLEDNPAYQSFLKNSGGASRFSIRGLQGRDLAKAMAQVNYFLELKSSTIKGAEEVLKGVAARAGVSVEEIKADKDIVSEIWKTVSQVEQYLKSAGEIAANYDSTQLAQIVSTYIREQKTDLDNSVDDIMEIVKRYTGMDQEAERFGDGDVESDDFIRIV